MPESLRSIGGPHSTAQYSTVQHSTAQYALQVQYATAALLTLLHYRETAAPQDLVLLQLEAAYIAQLR